MKKKLLFVVNVDWFFISHRLPIAVKALNEGFEVYVTCLDTGQCDFIESQGIKVYRINLLRSSLNIFSELLSLFSIYRVIKLVSPDVVHAISIKAVLYTALCCKLIKLNSYVYSFSGLGFVYTDNGIKTRAVKFLITHLLKFAFKNEDNGKNLSVIFQNDVDRSFFVNSNIIRLEDSCLIKGSGVDFDDFMYHIPQLSNKTVLFCARLLKDKGIFEFCEAAKLLKLKYPYVKFIIAGDIDKGNPNSLSINDLSIYVDNHIVDYIGYCNDVASIITSSLMVVLPSYREGFPKSLIEAAACGRAVITTDVPGCKDAIIPGVTGLLVPAKQINELVLAIEYLLINPQIAIEMGISGREFAISNFSIHDVIKKHINIYNNIK